MYAISFRVFIAKLGNQKVFINGSAISNKKYAVGQSIFVQGAAASSSGSLNSMSTYKAEVLMSAPTKREAGSFEWDILDD